MRVSAQRAGLNTTEKLAAILKHQPPTPRPKKTKHARSLSVQEAQAGTANAGRQQENAGIAKKVFSVPNVSYIWDMEQQLPDGWFSDSDIATYRKIYESLPDHAIAVEVGVWKGRSICSVADIILRKGIRVLAVDTFEGTESEGDAHKEAVNGDIETQFRNNVASFGLSKSVTVIKQNSLDAADAFRDERFDFVFIDADHSSEAVRDDIDAWLPMADLLCGHDWSWESVRCGIAESGHTATELSGNIWCLNDALLSIIIPTWQGEQRVSNLLKTIKDNTTDERLSKIEIVVVNNNPLTAKQYEVPSMRIQSVNEFTKGFGHACNAGAREARGRHLLFLNDDCEILSYWPNDLWVDLLLAELTKDKVGAVGVHELYDEVLNFKFLVGFFLAIKKELFNKIGGFSIYEWGGGEDIELCYLLYCNGYRLSNIGKTSHGEYPIYHEAEGTLHDPEHKEKWEGGLFKDNLQKMYENVKDMKPLVVNKGVTAVVPTRGRYNTTLPMTLCHIACQTILPYEVIVYDDNDEPVDIREWETIGSILRMFESIGINWRWQFAPRRGAWASHALSIKEAKTKYIWRVDDDCFPQNNVLETLLEHVEEDVVAVGGSVRFIGRDFHKKPKGFTNKLAFIDSLPNAQWFDSDEVVEAEHLYSTFLYDREAAMDLEWPELSRKSFREETILTLHLSKKGRLLIAPCVTHHAYASGGIRSSDTNEQAMFNHDQNLFEFWLKSNFNSIPKGKVLVAANGKGDAENLLYYADTELSNKEVVVFSVDNCKDVFEGYEVYGFDAANLFGIDTNAHNIYEHMAKTNFKGTILDAYRNLYG